MIDDYTEGRLTQNRLLYRAIVVRIDNEGGMLESEPPNPPGSIRARVYTHGLDATTPEDALTIFHPFFPGHMLPPVEPDEHVYVIFEDNGSYSHGLWVTTIPHLRDLNFNDPEEDRQGTPSAANTFEGTSPSSTQTNRDTEFGGTSEEDRARQETVEVFRSNETSVFEGKRVLHIGDSQVAGAYGRELGEVIRERGASTYTRDGRSSWGVYAWLNRRLRGTRPTHDSLETVIQNARPDILIINLGGNDTSRLGRGDFEAKYREFFGRALAAMGGGRVIWASPVTAVGRSAPRDPARRRVGAVIRTIVGGNYVETADITRNITGGGRDRVGLHFSRNGGRIFSESVIGRMEQAI